MARDDGDRGRGERPPDVEIGAGVSAKRLRFREKPRTEVEVHGEVVEHDGGREAETSSGSERRNLPDEVEPGVTYEDVDVRWHATARIDEDDESGPSEEERRKR